MSTGSYLYLIRKHKDEHIGEDDVRSEIGKTLFLNPMETEEERENTINSLLKQKFADLPGEHMVDTSDMTVCSVCLKRRFGSWFDSISDHYCLNQYKYGENQVVIGLDAAKRMIQALDFLIFGNTVRLYDFVTEKLMNNDWIAIFGDSLPSYIKSKIGEDGFAGIEDEETETIGLSDLKRFRSLLESYVDSSEDSWSDENFEYIVVYEKW